VSLYTRAVRPALFSLDAERAHDLTISLLHQPLVLAALRMRPRAAPDPRLHIDLLGHSFEHPVGLAAGLDKQGTAVLAWEALGFSFAEIGTITPRPQPGNPRPRLFRLQPDRAIINRFGFNSVGAEQAGRNLGDVEPGRLIVGVNIGKNRETPNERAAEDCIRVIDALHRFADYFVLNVSSPNTERLRELQESRALRALVGELTGRLQQVGPQRPVPLLVKVSPDSEADDLLRSVDAALEGGASGVVATNTTVKREGLSPGARFSTESGGLSGAPLKNAANAICRLLFRHVGTRVPIIGVGGVFSADDAYERIRSGAALLQLYTALIYDGPIVVRRILAGLGERLARDGFSNVREAVGIDVS
jgi:dihydroorotate dehydrogenase